MMTRIFAALVMAQLVVATPRVVIAEDSLLDRIDQSVRRAEKYLDNTQSADGAWRSQTYGCFRDGVALTPHVLSALCGMRGVDDSSSAGLKRSASLIASWVDEKGQLAKPASMPFPVYTAAEASWSIRHANLDGRQDRIHAAFVALLREHQMNESLGWSRSDVQFGGWGYAMFPTRRPSASPSDLSPIEANISATLYAVGAIYLANSSSDPVNQQALERAGQFVRRCHNFNDASESIDRRFDDGGFFFSPSDPAGNKAGPAGVDRHGRIRMRSYGSATADGLRALIMCNLPHDDPRIRAARGWLIRHFSAKQNPGTFAPDREVLRNATYYYYCWSVTHALLLLDVEVVGAADQKTSWAKALAIELIRRQQEDGSWRNRFTDSKEDDPLVATPFAFSALRICQKRLRRSSAPSTTDGE